MRRIVFVLVLACLSMWLPGAAQQVPHVLLVSIDGLMPTTYSHPPPPDVPTLRKLAADGSAAEGVVGVLPTVTYPSHTTLVTGVRPAIHGIFDNRISDPEGISSRAWFWYAAQVRVPTLVSAARAQNMVTAAVNWPVTIRSDAHYLVPEYERSSHPEARYMLDALSTPGLLRAVEIARGTPLPWPLDDEARTDIARHLLKTYRPQITLLHLLRVDGRQHEFGPGSPEAVQAIEDADRQVGRLVATLDETGMRQNTIVVIVSDHGFLPFTRVLHPNALFKQEGLLNVNEAGAITSWRAYFHSSGGSGWVYLHDDSAELRERVRGLLARLKSNPEAGIETIWDAAELSKLEAHPDAAFGFDVKNGWYTDIAHDTLITSSNHVRGAHGFNPARRELYSSLILNGPGVPHRSLGIVRMTQVAPTLARMLGISLSSRADSPLF